MKKKNTKKKKKEIPFVESYLETTWDCPNCCSANSECGDANGNEVKCSECGLLVELCG